MKIGVISYLLRHMGTAAAMDFLSDIGFAYTELDFRHADGLTDYHKVDAKGAAAARSLCISHGITPMAYCVGGLGKQNEGPYLKNVFEFASGLGVEVITGVLDPALLPDLDVFCEQYKLYYAIENHHGNVFEQADTILKALEGHSKFIGVNPDTGHFASAGYNPVTEVMKLAGRVYNIHFKNLEQAKPLSEPGIDMAAVFKTLKLQGFDRLLSIEHYEYDGISDADLSKGLSNALGYVTGLVQATA